MAVLEKQMAHRVTLEEAVAEDAYAWLERNSPLLLQAVNNALSDNKSPAQIRMAVSRMVGPDRQGLALRCYQAAQWVAGEFDQ